MRVKAMIFTTAYAKNYEHWFKML